MKFEAVRNTICDRNTGKRQHENAAKHHQEAEKQFYARLVVLYNMTINNIQKNEFTKL